MTDFSNKIFIIDDFKIDLINRYLFYNDKLLSLNTKYFDVLVYLIQNNNRLITKDELFLNIWGDTFVTDTALSQCIKDIRKILNDNAKNPQYLKTVPKHGFIFLKEPQIITDQQQIKEFTCKKFAKRPYKFLDYFTEQDTDIFFGREQEISTICSKIINHRSFLIYGRSGVGKSSITHAGLVPELKKQGHLAFIIRSFSDPVKELLNTQNGKNYPGSDKFNICFFDQFEDFFLLAQPQIRKRFIDKIETLLKNYNVKFKPVFIVREDLLAEMNVFKSILPEIFFHEHRLQRLTFDQAKSAIQNPVMLMNIKIEESLTEKIIDDLLENGFVDPPQLQIVCDTLFDKKNSSSTLLLKSYKELGEAKQILTGYLERVLRHFPMPDLEIIKYILLNLINDKSNKQVLLITELQQILSNHCAGNTFQGIVEELSAHRIVRIFRSEAETWIELTHDFLAVEISKWENVEFESLRKARKLFDRAFDNYNNHNLFPSEETISLIIPLAEKIINHNEKFDFWLACLLNFGKSIPQWLIQKSTNAGKQLLNAIKNKNPEIRISAIESSKYLRDEELMAQVKKTALTDKELQVRKSASNALAEVYGIKTKDILSDFSDSIGINILQLTISLACVRDYNKNFVNLPKTNPLISIMVLGGLLWVRFRRHHTEILKRALRAGSGTALSGFIVGLLLGFLLIFYRNQPLFESTTIFLSLISLGMLSGFLVGFGIAFGMISLKLIGKRHSKWWLIIGATLGGGIVGGIINILGVDFFIALSGQKIVGLAGAFEAASIGLGLSVGYLVSDTFSSKSNWTKMLYPALGAMIIAIILTLIEGSLFSASIEKIAKSFVESKMDFKPVANLFGEKYFGQISRLSLAAFEGFIFGASFYIADKFRFFYMKYKGS